MADFVTVASVKEQANIPQDDAAHDFELMRYAKAAQEVVESIVGPVTASTVTETITQNGVVVLGAYPVAAVTSVTQDGVSVTGWSLSNGSGVLSGLPLGTVTIEYTAGRTTAPYAVQVAGAIIAAHLWDTQRGNSPSAMPMQDTFVPTGSGFAVPNRAMELLAPFKLPPVVA